MQISFQNIDFPSDDVLTNCMHCGLCLPVCPTFALTGNEKSSPRGRIRLIKSVAQGKLGLTQGFINEMNFCLDCQACETVCPAGVKYGSLVEAARNQIRIAGKESWGENILKKIVFRNIFTNNTLLSLTAKLIRFYQSIGLESFINRFGVLRFVSFKIFTLHKLLPRFDKIFFNEKYPEIIKPKGTVKYRVGLLSGCLMNVAFAKINEDTVKVLLHHDCEVIIPKQQVCCGSIQGHHGDFDTARELARKNIDAFSKSNLAAIIMNSSGCGAYMKEYGHLLNDDPAYAEKAKAFSLEVKDLSEFLYDIGLKPPTKKLNCKVTYQDACHLIHTQKISIQPRALIKLIPGVEFKELDESSWCCGSAGLYNVIRTEDSMKILERKIENIKETDTDIIVVNNHGCIAQIGYGCRENKHQGEVLHLASLLARAYS